MNIYNEANRRIEFFIKNNLSSYHELRNYDFGVNKRFNVSEISKYISHRILYEYEIINRIKVLDKRKKFTDELLWKIYWKGYLENHKSIWLEYKNFKDKSYDSNVYETAKKGNTGIDCFDSWVEELRENNYLHNHSRMWFASIWIFSLKLPWQLGADFFIKHLIDGDASSNTLSWRWVAGLHTNNKPYIANKENIRKYTIKRFKDLESNLSGKSIFINKKMYPSNHLPIKTSYRKSNLLLMFDNDLYIYNRLELFNSYSKVYIIQHDNVESEYKLSNNVINFKEKLITSVNNLISNSMITTLKELDKLIEDLKSVDIIYPSIGNNLDLINKFIRRKQLKFRFIFRDDDLLYWKYTKSGFNHFKKEFFKHDS